LVFFGLISSWLARGGQLILLGDHFEKSGFSGAPYLLIWSYCSCANTLYPAQASQCDKCNLTQLQQISDVKIVA